MSGLTASSSTFTRREVVQAVAERASTGLPVVEVERFADQLLAHHRGGQVVELGPARGGLRSVDVIRRSDGRVVPADPHGRRYTTRGWCWSSSTPSPPPWPAPANAAGIPVVGYAVAARAALELQQSAGIRSTTLASLLAPLLHHAVERSGKVVLVGDPRQLHEIDAGGLYRALTHGCPSSS